MNRRTRSSWLPACGLFGPRAPYAGGRLAGYLMMRRAGLQPPPHPFSPPDSFGELATTAGGDRAGIEVPDQAEVPARILVKVRAEGLW